MLFRPKFLKPFSTCFSSFFLALSLYMAVSLISYDLFAQEDSEEELVTTIIEKSTSVFINREVVEILTLKDSNDDLLADKSITATVDDPDIVTISILEPSSEDREIVEGSVLAAKTRENGKKAFSIKGISSGSTKITFQVFGEDDSSLATEELTVNVIDLQAIIQSDKVMGEAPLTVQFFDKSIGKTDTIIWNFGNNDLVINTEKNPVHTFENTGMFDVTLEITQSTNSGTFSDKANVSICVTPGDVGLPGVIFGTVFDPISNSPLNKVKVLLLTDTGEKLQKTGRDGVYRFENVLPGTVIFTVCKPPFFECIVEELSFNGGSLTKNLELTRRVVQ